MRKALNDAEIDPILSGKDEILPSSGFVASVMEAVRREAAAPPPIPFPWKRALPGLALVVATLVLVAIIGFATFTQGGGAPAPQVVADTQAVLTQGSQAKLVTAALWAGLSLVLAWVIVKLSLRLSTGNA